MSDLSAFLGEVPASSIFAEPENFGRTLLQSVTPRQISEPVLAAGHPNTNSIPVTLQRTHTPAYTLSRPATSNTATSTVNMDDMFVSSGDLAVPTHGRVTNSSTNVVETNRAHNNILRQDPASHIRMAIPATTSQIQHRPPSPMVVRQPQINLEMALPGGEPRVNPERTISFSSVSRANVVDIPSSIQAAAAAASATTRSTSTSSTATSGNSPLNFYQLLAAQMVANSAANTGTGGVRPFSGEVGSGPRNTSANSLSVDRYSRSMGPGLGQSTTTTSTTPSGANIISIRRSGAPGYSASGISPTNSVRPQFRGKIVCNLSCGDCSVLVVSVQFRYFCDFSGAWKARPVPLFLTVYLDHNFSKKCKRGMKAILLADTNVELFSTDSPPIGVQMVNDDYVTRNCHCRIRDVACLNCGNLVGTVSQAATMAIFGCSI
ncbi:Protein fam72a [Blyttiomyces sp. JEL0837]|nr:Protein fam72a [Blyttiomyces sp. JEL0837]